MSYYDNDYSDDMYDRYMHTGEGAEYFEEESPCEYIPPRRRYYKVSSGKHSNDELDEIIRRLKQQKKEESPTVIVILTDGYATFPREKEALGIPVLWCIVDNKNDAPWGKTIHMSMTSF